METDAIFAVFSRLESGEWQWISSSVVDDELDRIKDRNRRRKISELESYISDRVFIELTDLPRINRLHDLGFKLFDAMHITCAEKGAAKILLTTDDKLESRAERVSEILDVRVVNPLSWLREDFGI